MNEEEREQEEQSPRRPRVIDKRISARPPDEKSAQPSQPASTATGASSAGTGAARPPGAGTPSSVVVGAEPAAEVSAPPVPEEPLVGQVEQPGVPAAPSAAAPQGQRVWTPEQEAEAARMAQEIADTPSFEWVVNTAVTLANVAATKLELGSGGDAHLAIDALAGLLNSVGSRLQQAESPLRQTLAQLQLAYAERQPAPPPPP
jgi:hypothetical protein